MNPKQTYIAYGSESGNAKQLAEELFQQLDSSHSPLLMTLNEVDLDALQENDTLLIITSSFGDGEPTGNAELFYEKLIAQPLIQCKFAVFGLGDVSYSQFCGFSIAVDKCLRECGAFPIAQRVDADTHYRYFFEQWKNAILEHFAGNESTLKNLNLQVKAYSENQSFPATIQTAKQINSGEFPVFDIHIDITGSGMNYQPGDLLYVLPPPNQSTLSRLADFYGALSEEQLTAFGNKELRQIGKPILRALVKKTANPDLKKLIKMSAAAELAKYLYGRDIADILNDFCTPDKVGIDDLLAILSNQLPRAYSIASCGKASPNLVRLCVREVDYELDGKHYYGSGSHFLSHSAAGSEVRVYVRANPHFHLPDDRKTPVIMIGSGTGIAPYLGFLEQHRQGESHLFFGERYRQHDFLYCDELARHIENGSLTALYTAFSRDQEQKYYVQDALTEQGDTVWQLLQDNAEIYLCGSKNNLAKPIDNALRDIAIRHGNLNEEEAKAWLLALNSDNRFHKDLY